MGNNQDAFIALPKKYVCIAELAQAIVNEYVGRSSFTRRICLAASKGRMWSSSSTSWMRWKFPYWQNP